MKQDTRNGQSQKYAAGSAPKLQNGIAYLLIGGGIGATLALLFAPKSGSELRSDIADVTKKGYDAAAEKARLLNERSGIADAVKEKAEAISSYAARTTDPSADTATDTINKVVSTTESIANDMEKNRVRPGGFGANADIS